MEYAGATLAAVGIALYAIDNYTSVPGTNCNSGGQPFNVNYCGKVYGPGAPLAFVLSSNNPIQIDPTTLIVAAGVLLWVWEKYGK